MQCCTRVHFVLDVVTKLYTLDVLLEYSKTRIRKEKLVPSIQEAKQTSTEIILRPPVYDDAPWNVCNKYITVTVVVIRSS